MLCPKCKQGEIKEQVSITGLIFKKKNVYFYCPLCDYQNNKEFKLSKKDLGYEDYERFKVAEAKGKVITHRKSLFLFTL